MKLKIKESIVNGTALSLLYFVAVIFIGLYGIYEAKTTGPMNINGAGKISLMLVAVVACFTPILIIINSNRRRREDTDWVIHQLNVLHQKIHTQPSEETKEDTLPIEKKWPWGNHHTQLLGHLEAAANTYWILYDPSDPSTAPTNNMVATWLRETRGVSADKAMAIASILRADGLKTGPR